MENIDSNISSEEELVGIDEVQKFLNRSRASVYRYTNTDLRNLNPTFNPRKLNPEFRTDQKDPLEVTVKLDGRVFLGESEVKVENIIPRLNAITDQNTKTRIYIRGDRVVAYGRIMEIMSIINSAGYEKVALVTQNPKE